MNDADPRPDPSPWSFFRQFRLRTMLALTAFVALLSVMLRWLLRAAAGWDQDARLAFFVLAIVAMPPLMMILASLLRSLSRWRKRRRQRREP